MARTKRIDFESQLQKIDNQIFEAQDKLTALKNEKDAVLQNKKEYELEQLYQLAMQKGKSITDIIQSLSDPIALKKPQSK